MGVPFWKVPLSCGGGGSGTAVINGADVPLGEWLSECNLARSRSFGMKVIYIHVSEQLTAASMLTRPFLFTRWRRCSVPGGG